MLHTGLLAEQIALERDQLRGGREKLRNNTAKLEDKSYASASEYGISSIDILLPLVIAVMKDTNNRIHEGKTGVSFAEIKHFLVDLEFEVAAAIASKVTIDMVFSSKPRANLVQNVTDALGTAVENECMLSHYERNVPGLLHTLKKNYWHKACGTEQKVKVIRTLMNRYDVDHWKAWGIKNRIKLGTWMLDSVCKASQWFEKELRRTGRKTETFIVPTPDFLMIRDSVMYQAELFSPLAWPMLIPPNDWTEKGGGGYVFNEIMDNYPFVRRGDPTLIQGKKILAFVNQIQGVAYTLNPFIVDVARTLEERGHVVGKFVPIVDLPLPNKPLDIDTNKDSEMEYRRATAEVMNQNAQQFKRSCRTRMTMNAVSVFEDKEEFYIPWSCDYRGRVYPIPNLLTPQDTDFGKSLLLFKQKAFMTPAAEGWLRFQVATTKGLDKSTMEDRINDTLQNHEVITRIATDPIGNIGDWECVDEPWQYLAACHHYYHTCILCDWNYTNLPVAVDATCSGLQILAGLARDASTARLVNVLPSDTPQDAYKVIAEVAKPNVPESIRPHMDRKTTKRTVMTVPYNAKPFSNRSYIREALKEKEVEISKEELTETVNAVRAAMNEVVPGPMRVMKWIESEVGKAIDRGARELKWTTPSGFKVRQKLMKKQLETVELQLLGRCKIKIATQDGDKVDKSHHKNATAPNLIHSLDASLLALSATRFNAPLAVIHDSVLCRATDMDTLSALVRETYMHLFAEHDYLTSWAEQIGATTEPPIIDTLKPESVIESTYFFC